MKISAIVVTYNRLQLLKKCLKGLCSQTCPVNNIFIINNNSSDGTKKYLNKIKDKNIFHPINLNKNLGGAGGFSLGTEKAYEVTDDDYFWLMDDDSVPTKDALKAMMLSAKKLNDNFGFLCSNVRWGKDREPCIANVPHVSFDWTESLNIGLVKLTNATFVSVLFKRKSVKKLGLPIADMFIWGDDTEYTTRLSRYSKSYLVSDSIVDHESAKNTHGNEGSVFNISYNRISYYKYEVRNLIYIYKKYYDIHKVLKLLLNDIYVLIKIPFYSNDHKLFRFYCVLSGIIRGFSFNPKVRFPK